MTYGQFTAAFVGLRSCTAAPLSAQIRYDVSLPDAAHHAAWFTLTDLPPRPVALWR